jgi:hypothetical protein
MLEWQEDSCPMLCSSCPLPLLVDICAPNFLWFSQRIWSGPGRAAVLLQDGANGPSDVSCSAAPSLEETERAWWMLPATSPQGHNTDFIACWLQVYRNMLSGSPLADSRWSAFTALSYPCNISTLTSCYSFSTFGTDLGSAKLWFWKSRVLNIRGTQCWAYMTVLVRPLVT